MAEGTCVLRETEHSINARFILTRGHRIKCLHAFP
jgi:hypothetical protein